jgi:hypothetical protein
MISNNCILFRQEFQPTNKINNYLCSITKSCYDYDIPKFYSEGDRSICEFVLGVS